MPGFYRVTFLPEGRKVQFAGSRGNHYDLADGSRLDLHSVPVWCRSCGGIAHGEWLPTLDELDRQLADFRETTSQEYKLTARGALHDLTGGGDAFLEQQIAECQRRREWRSRRSAPAKCIRCGSTDIVPLPAGQCVPHPAGRGSIRLDCIGMCSTGFNGWFFTPEGDRIPRKPTPADGYFVGASRTSTEIDRERDESDAIKRFRATADIHPSVTTRQRTPLLRRIGHWLGQNRG